MRCLELFESLGLRPNVARTKLLQSEIAAAKGNISQALDMQAMVLTEFTEIGDNQGVADALDVMASTISVQGSDHELAILLASAAATLRGELNVGVGPAREKLFQEQLKKSLAAVGRSAAESAASKGRTLAISQVAELIRNR